MNFTLDWRAPSLNKLLREHWSRREKHLQNVGWLIKSAIGVPRERAACKMRVTLRVVTRAHAQDQDNASGAAKIILDSLKRFGWIHDDSPEWCELVMLPTEAGKPRVDVEMEEASGLPLAAR